MTAPTRGRAWLRRAEVLGRWLLVLVACYLGGVAATNLAPTRAETAHYQAVLRLEPIPRAEPVLHAPTIVGDVDLEFSSPLLAPGIDVDVSVRPEITGVLTRPGVSVQALTPDDAEISSAIEQAATGIAIRFAIGAAVVALSLMVGIHYALRRRPVWRHALLVGTAWATSLVLTAAGIAWTYQPSRFVTFTTTGVLGIVQRNAGMLEGVEARAESVTPYLRNLLAVSQALQQKFVPGELAKPTAARFLLVSDIHGANQYSLMRSLVQEEQVDAVIDSGDLINFGRVQEAEASGLFKGIESLGVPYIFVSGNHDQSSPTDHALIQRLSRIPNVVLLQKADNAYQELDFHGLTIAGFNDPRWFGDDNEDPVAKEAPAVAAFNRTMADQPEPDIVVAHEPYAAEYVDKARILINGHMHTAGLFGNRIQVGTFTGGGLFTHYTIDENKDKSELSGQPYAFDVMTFGTACNLTQLTRYSYRNLLEGRPAYDSIQVINGATIEPTVAPPPDSAPGEAAPAETPRECGPQVPTTIRTIPQVPEGETPGATEQPSPTTTPIPTTGPARTARP